MPYNDTLGTWKINLVHFQPKFFPEKVFSAKYFFTPPSSFNNQTRSLIRSIIFSRYSIRKCTLASNFWPKKHHFSKKKYFLADKINFEQINIFWRKKSILQKKIFFAQKMFGLKNHFGRIWIWPKKYPLVKRTFILKYTVNEISNFQLWLNETLTNVSRASNCSRCWRHCCFYANFWILRG